MKAVLSSIIAIVATSKCRMLSNVFYDKLT